MNTFGGAQQAATVTNGSTDLSKDFGYRPTGAVSGRVFEDVDRDGTVDVGEPGMGTVEFDLSKISLDTGGLGKTEPTLDVSGGVPAIPEIDLSGISLDLGGETTTTGGATGTGSGKDDHWYDVQTKFDLAKAYQEMGDKEGAREILQEVIAEGDSDQQAAAQRVLESLA